MKSTWDLIKQTFRDWSDDKASRLAAAMSYYTLFSLAPLLVIAIAIAGLVFGQSRAEQALIGQITNLMGSKGASAIQGMISNASRPGASISAMIIGVVTLLFGASGVFGELQGALNTIWEVKPDPKRGFWGMVKDRFLSFTMVLGIGFLLLVSLVVSTALSVILGFFQNLLPGGYGVVAQIINIVVSLGVITLLFALIFKFLPDAEIRWKDVWIGAFVTAVLFTIGKTLLGLYLGRGSVTSVYGAAGSLVIILLWVYYSAQILFFGAEFTQVYARRHGAEIVPKRGAVRLTEGELSQQGVSRPARAPSRPAAQSGVVANYPVPATGTTGTSPAQATLPLHRRYPQRTDPGLPPMPAGVKALARVAGGLVAAIGVTAMLFTRTTAAAPGRKIRKEGRQIQKSGVSMTKEGTHLVDVAGSLQAAARNLAAEAGKMHGAATRLSSEAAHLSGQGNKMERKGARLRLRGKKIVL